MYVGVLVDAVFEGVVHQAVGIVDGVVGLDKDVEAVLSENGGVEGSVEDQGEVLARLYRFGQDGVKDFGGLISHNSHVEGRASGKGLVARVVGELQRDGFGIAHGAGCDGRQDLIHIHDAVGIAVAQADSVPCLSHGIYFRRAGSVKLFCHQQRKLASVRIVGIFGEVFCQSIKGDTGGLLFANRYYVVVETIVVGAFAAFTQQIEPVVGHTAVGVYAAIVGVVGHPVLSTIGVGILVGFGIGHVAESATKFVTDGPF